MYVRMYVCMYERMYVRTYFRTYVCMRACMYVRVPGVSQNMSTLPFRAVPASGRFLRFGSDQVTEFIVEITPWISLKHANVLTLLAMCPEPANLCIVTDLIPRGSLWDVLHKVGAYRRPLAPPRERERAGGVLSGASAPEAAAGSTERPAGRQ